jgi:alpha-glucosidase (family GH31 glycosyl hydrolase)
MKGPKNKTYFKRRIVNRILFIIIFTALSSSHCFSKAYKIQDNSLYFKDACIQILTPTLFRIQQGIQQTPPIPDLGIVNVKFEKVPFLIKEYRHVYSIQTDSLTIIYDPSKEITQGGIQVFLKSNPTYYVLKSLSERDTLNLGGVIPSLDNCKGDMKYDEQNDVSSKSHLHLIPDGILSRRGFTVLRHTKDTLYIYKEGDKYQDLYVLGYGDDFKQAFNDFYRLTGKIPMLPKWSLGFIYSRWADYNANDYKNIVSQFRQEKMPIDAIILDMCWHTDYWYGYRIDTHNFPDIKAFNFWADSVHVETGFNHHSGCIYSKDPHIQEFCQKAGLDYNKALIPGLSWEPDKKDIHYDTKNKRQFTAFYDIYLYPLIKDGFDFLWVDGENSIYSSELYQDYLTQETHKRAFVMNRLHSDVLCNHRYPVGFSGDTYISWETMAYSLEANIKGGNCGVYWSHDIGGYMPQGPAGYPPSGELFARWLQLGAVSPVFRVHAKKAAYWTPPCNPGDFDQGSRLPWEWGDTVLRSARISIQLRYKLLPYIYTMTRNAHDTGMPLCRGLYLEYPQSDKSYRFDEYLFGDNFLAAPILNASDEGTDAKTSRNLWLPKGDWYDYFTNKLYQGNQDISVIKSLFQFPLFVKAGSIIPMSPYRNYSGAPLDTLLIVAYTPTKSSKTTFNLYEDDGESFLFEQNQFRWVKLSYEYTNHIEQKIVIHKALGSFQGNVTQRVYKIQIVNTTKPKIVSINGHIFTNWSWDATTRLLSIDIHKQDVNADLIIEAKL